MREFWNQRAREDALFFVDDRRAYGDSQVGSFWEQGERDLDRLLGSLDVRIEPDAIALDLGCGVGRLTRAIAARAREVFALDISAEMIDRAQREHADVTNVRWLVGDGETLRPLADEAVDLCVSHVVFQHIPDPGVTLAYVAEMARVTRPGGTIVFQFSNNAEVHRPRRGALARVRHLAAGIGRAPRGQDDPAWLGSAVELGDVRALAARSGLKLLRIVGEGTQFCAIRATKLALAAAGPPPRPPARPSPGD